MVAEHFLSGQSRDLFAGADGSAEAHPLQSGIVAIWVTNHESSG
jgi:hypothetical protein